MFANIKYMELFIGDKENDSEGNQLAELLAICNFVENISWQKLLCVSEEEYNTNVNKITKR